MLVLDLLNEIVFEAEDIHTPASAKPRWVMTVRDLELDCQLSLPAAAGCGAYLGDKDSKFRLVARRSPL